MKKLTLIKEQRLIKHSKQIQIAKACLVEMERRRKFFQKQSDKPTITYETVLQKNADKQNTTLQVNSLLLEKILRLLKKKSNLYELFIEQHVTSGLQIA